MKHKLSLLLTIGALAFGGTAAGLVGAKSAQLTKAAAGDYTSSIQLVGAALDVGWTNTANTAYQFVEQSDGSFSWTGSFKVERFRAVIPGSWTKALNWDNVVATSAKVADGTFVQASTKGSDTDNNIWCTVAGVYTLQLDSGKTQLSIIAPAVAQYNVSEFAVVDGTKEATAYATEIATAGYTFTPTDVNRTGYFFGGWFTDSACTTAYSSTTWSAAGNLYAKYTSVTDRAIYFGGTTWTNTYAYSFGGDQEFGAWPGTKIATVTDGVSYQGKYSVTKVALTKNDTKIIFNDGTVSGGVKLTNQTNDLSIVDKAYYWLDAADGSTGDADKGLAAAVVYDINVARKAVVASGSILAASICGISKATATNLIGEYDALNATAKGYVDAATDYVYDYTDTSKGADVSFANIVAELRKISGTSGSAVVGVVLDNNTTPVLVMVISLGVAALAAGGLWMSRRKER